MRGLKNDHKDRIIHLLTTGLIDARIAEIENCHPSTVKKIRTYWRKFGHHTRPAEDRIKPGPTPKITPEAVHALIGFLAAKPDSYLREMQQFLSNQYGINVSQGAICKALQHSNITRTRTKRKAQERHESYQAAKNSSSVVLDHTLDAKMSTLQLPEYAEVLSLTTT